MATCAIASSSVVTRQSQKSSQRPAQIPPSSPTSRRRPIPNSYWATPFVVACEYPYSPATRQQKLDALLLAGVRTFVDLTEPGELSPYAPHRLAHRATLLGIDPASIDYRRFPIPDRCLPASVEYMHAILDTLRDAQDRGRVTAVHCRGGIGRTGMVVGCWLVEAGYVRDGEEALARVAEMWRGVEKCVRFPCSPETGPQFEFVRNFKPRLALSGAGPSLARVRVVSS